MLVLARKRNQGIQIGLDVTIVVVEIRGDKVRLGITAPENMPVHRGEVFGAIGADEVRRRIAAGEPVHKIRKDLDCYENRPKTINVIPKASLRKNPKQL